MRKYWRVNSFEYRFKHEDNKATVYDYESKNLNTLKSWSMDELGRFANLV